jgi:hypothetical protein
MFLEHDLNRIENSALGKLPNSFSFSYHGKKKISEVIKESFLSKLETKKNEPIIEEAFTERVSFIESRNPQNSEPIDERVSCLYCKRLFARDRIEKHQRVCESNFKKHEISKKLSPRPFKSIKSLSNQRQFHYPNSKWQRQHNDLINKLRFHDTTDDYEEYIQCPHCERKFAPGPGEKHIEKCKNIIHKPKPPPKKILPELKKRNQSYSKDKNFDSFSGRNSPRIEDKINDGGITERIGIDDLALQDSQISIMKKVKIKHLTEPRSKSIYKMNNNACRCGEVLPARAVYCMMCGTCRYVK